MPAEERRRRALEEKREVVGDCWLWTGSVMSLGYGQYRTDSENLYVHRMAYELYVGPIPEGQLLHHLCEQKRCFNLEHLSLTTRAEHIKLHRLTEGGST